ncbi:arsenic resistance N-acetyltransferase ArsN2 [Rubrivirga sp.]|uniref:arsenic resistance N-acetyltransferase ArsN2 n=1 Tax=Rubrivirga sp. TaxID=1885344 RepID=UPI003B52C3E5
MTTAADARPSVLFVCTHNSARSQLAEGLLRDRHGDRFEAFSAGTVARGVHPLAADALREVDIDPSGQTSKTIDELGDRTFDVVVTVCDSAREACPYLPARIRNVHRAFRDPSAVEGSEAERRAAFAAVRDEIGAWLDAAFGRPEPATSADWPALRDLLSASDLPTRDLSASDAGRFLVLRAGNAVVGCVAVEPYGDAGLLRSLAVAPELRGLGLGDRLVDAAEATARTGGLGSLVLLTTTAAGFFQARGYAPLDRADAPPAIRQSSEFTATCPASAACLGKALSP